MSVSGELLCSFELLKPLDSSALKQQMKKSKNKRSSMMPQSPVSNHVRTISHIILITNSFCVSQPATQIAQSV